MDQINIVKAYLENLFITNNFLIFIKLLSGMEILRSIRARMLTQLLTFIDNL